MPPRMNGADYLHFLQFQLPGLIQDLNFPPQNVARMIFVHDGAGPHHTNDVRDYLNAAFPGRWMGRNSVNRWPTRSPDFTPLDYFLWGKVKDTVYKGEIIYEDLLWNRIQQAFDELRASPEMLRRATHDISRRLRFCLAVNGEHFEQYPHDAV